MNQTYEWKPLVEHLREKDLFITIVFCFSKNKCELAVESLETFDILPNAQDKNYVHSFVDRALSRLREEDRNLPQVIRTYNNLKKGISAHHAGLLPLVKEVTEMLFSESYVKLQFATETFAIEVNMPARSVVFSAVQKHDGRRRRILIILANQRAEEGLTNPPDLRSPAGFAFSATMSHFSMPQ